MWAIIKFDKKNLTGLKRDLSNKLGSNPKFYLPKVKIQKFKKGRLFSFESFLLGDYMFCFHENFKNINTINSLKYCKGLKYFLNSFIKSQEEIVEFIKNCKNHENNKGYISQTFFSFKENSKFKFLSGPFTDMIFNIIATQNKKIKILIGDFKTTVSNTEYLYRPV